ncbi:MAG: DUF917 domain-containing protein [Candidatus Heimdallarchaeota archaeon]
MKELSKQEIEDLLQGAKVLGAGGGGEIEWARPMIEDVYSKGKTFSLVDPKDLPDDEYVAIVGLVGGGVSEAVKKKVAGLPRIQKPEIVATTELSNYLNKELYAFIASEIGAGNSIVPLYVGAMTDRPAVDADCCGRAKPEIVNSTTNVKGIPVTPLAIVSPFGDKMILREAVNDSRAEDICRYMAIVSGGMCGVARCPTKGKDIRTAIVHNSITNAIRIGREVREAIEQEQNPVNALIKSIGGFKFFEGELTSFTREEEGAFIWGEIEAIGKNDYLGDTLRVWYKNEFLISYKNEQPFITCPDTICIVDAITAKGLSNWGGDFQRGRPVVVFGVPAHELWRTERGLELFSPKYFGYDIEYNPIEDLVKED